MTTHRTYSIVPVRGHYITHTSIATFLALHKLAIRNFSESPWYVSLPYYYFTSKVSRRIAFSNKGYILGCPQ